VNVKRICRYFLFVLPVLCMPMAHAQSLDVGVGFGAMQDKASSNGLTVDSFGNLVSCSGSGAGCSPTKSLDGFAMGFSGDLMLWKHFGVGADVLFQPGKRDYAVLDATGTGLTSLSIQSRTTLYDFKGIIQPVKTRKAGLKLWGGIGGANIKFYESGTSSSFIGNQNFSQFFGSSNHFQVTGGAGVQIYVTDHMYIRPQFDVHYVHNLNQFGRNIVTAETVWIGYSFGQQ
jgi:hypothetical protein